MFIFEILLPKFRVPQEESDEVRSSVTGICDSSSGTGHEGADTVYVLAVAPFRGAVDDRKFERPFSSPGEAGGVVLSGGSGALPPSCRRKNQVSSQDDSEG
jgi:hypothetical protein